MNNDRPSGFTTRALHSRTPKADPHGATRYPIYAGVAYETERAEELEEAFAGRRPAHVYSRITNPTVEQFELRMTALEGGQGSVAVASGMAAVANALLALLNNGDHVVASRALFGGTYSLLVNVLQPLGIETTFVDCTDVDAVEAALRDNTRVLFTETIANPKMDVVDIQALGGLCRPKGVVLMIDSTVTTPYLVRPGELGADVVVHSSTKYISGGATSVGGVIVDCGSFDWSAYPGLPEKFRKLKKFALIARLRRETYRDLGACLAPQAASLQSLGLETLALRMERQCATSLGLAERLATMKGVEAVGYPGLASSPFRALAARQFGDRFGGILTLTLADKSTCFETLNRLQLARIATNLGDNTSLVIHPASTIFAEYDAATRESLGVTDGLIRVSVGLEDLDDLVDDFAQALGA